jgi:hypothetical protein
MKYKKQLPITFSKSITMVSEIAAAHPRSKLRGIH